MDCLKNALIVDLNSTLFVIFCNVHDFSFFSDRKLPLKEENGKEALNPETIEIKVASDIIQSKEDDSKA